MFCIGSPLKTLFGSQKTFYATRKCHIRNSDYFMNGWRMKVDDKGFILASDVRYQAGVLVGSGFDKSAKFKELRK